MEPPVRNGQPFHVLQYKVWHLFSPHSHKDLSLWNDVAITG